MFLPMTNRNDKLKKKSNSGRLKWQVSRFLSIKQTLQSLRGGKWRQSNLTGLFHHIKSLFGLNVFPFVWLQVISIFTSFLDLVTSWVRTLVSFRFCWCYSPGLLWITRGGLKCTQGSALGAQKPSSGVSTDCGRAVSLFSTYICCRDDRFYKKLCGSHRALKINSWEQNLSEKKKNLCNQFKLKKGMETDVCWEMWGKCPWVLINALWDQRYPDNTHLVLVISNKASVRKNGKTNLRNNGSFELL